MAKTKYVLVRSYSLNLIHVVDSLALEKNPLVNSFCKARPATEWLKIGDKTINPSDICAECDVAGSSGDEPEVTSGKQKHKNIDIYE